MLLGMPENCIPLQLNTVLVAGNKPLPNLLSLAVPSLRSSYYRTAAGLGIAEGWEMRKKFQGAAGGNVAAMEAMIQEAALFI